MSSVDVIIPCYNYGKYLRECVHSVLTQEGVNVRVLIIDDASPDDTPTIARELVAGNPRISYRRHKENLRHIATYNEGIDWTRGEYYLLLSADDLLAPGALARATNALDRHPNAVFCHGEVHIVNGSALGSQKILPKSEHMREKITCGKDFIAATCRNAANNPVWAPTAIVRTNVQKRVGGYNEKLPHSADLEMWIRLAQHGSILEILTVQGFYRRHEANMHYGYSGIKNLEEHLLTFQSAISSPHFQETDLQDLCMLYRRGLALGALRVANHALNNKDSMAFSKAMEFADRIYPQVRFSIAWYETRLRQAIGNRALLWMRRRFAFVNRLLR